MIDEMHRGSTAHPST
ncbi:Protein of unknown function [Bacillus wiedmannii]|uniref:Uncharacterized protein n=2 Tax=Bacillus cereus group TaxID=86661 RepID=A0A1C4EXR5_BACTU|nr:Protein of unknown function [Bacillus wiedmannii]SCC48296.1 Protein of unknown function [Bacillus thuringiensis]SCM00984.1 Protein of unknown function [Bacillus wiedmannii]